MEKTVAILFEERKAEFVGILNDYCSKLEAFIEKFEGFAVANPQLKDKAYLEDVLKMSRDERWNVYIPLHPLIYEFAELIKNFNHDACLPEYEEVLVATPWQSIGHLSHNAGAQQFGRSYSLMNKFFIDGNRSPGYVAVFMENFRYFVDQMICHMRSIMNSLGVRTEANEGEAGERSSVLEAAKIVLFTRVLARQLRILGVFDGENVPLAKMLIDSGLESSVPLSELAEILYVLVSNADRVMNKELSSKKDVGELVVDISANIVEHEDVKVLVLEVFNTGKLVDFNELGKKLLILPEAKIAAVSRDLLRRVRAAKVGSRQAKIGAGEEYLVIEGLTLTTDGTGIGLADLSRQLNMIGGVILLNNVYATKEGEKDGFCATVLLPHGQMEPPKGINKTLRRLKDALQSGKCWLEKGEEKWNVMSA